MEYNSKQELIKNALYQLVSETEFKKITVNDLCKEAHISRSTFYKTYLDKYDIFEQENQTICEKIDYSLQNFFSLTDIETSLNHLIKEIDQDKFLQLIVIEEGNVNLRRELKGVFERNYLLYYETNKIKKKWDISSHFAKDLFCSIGLTFLENSIKSQDEKRKTQNSTFIKEMVEMFLVSHS